MSNNFEDISLVIKGKATVGKLKVAVTGLEWKNATTLKTVAIAKEDINELTWTKLSDSFQVRVITKGDFSYKLNGFERANRAALEDFAKDNNINWRVVDISTKGWNWGDFKFESNHMQFLSESKLAFEIPLSTISQSVIQGKNELSVEFSSASSSAEGKESKGNEEFLSEMRLFVPSQEGDEDLEETRLDHLHKTILSSANISDDSNVDSLCVITDLMCIVPRGKYDFSCFPKYIKMSGKSFTYNIQYEHIEKLFLFEKPGGDESIFIFGLDPPIRQGRTSYPYLMIQFDNLEEIEADINMDEQELQEKYNGKLVPSMKGAKFEVVSHIMRTLSGKKLLRASKEFKSAREDSAVRCSCKAEDGLLFVLNSSFFFVKKPAVHFRHEDIISVKFERLDANTDLHTGSFDLEFRVRGGEGTLMFSAISAQEYAPLYNFFVEKKLNVLKAIDLKDVLKKTKGGRQIKKKDYSELDDPYMQRVREEADENEREENGEEKKKKKSEDMVDDEEDDEDFVGGDSSSDEEEYASKSDGSDSGSGSDSDDSDASGSGSDGEQMTANEKEKEKEKTKETKEKKKKDKEKQSNDSPRKKKGPKEGPKKALTTYFCFLREKRKEIADQHKGKTSSELGKIMGDLWKEMGLEEKAIYDKLAEDDKKRYEKEMAEWKEVNGVVGGAEGKKAERNGKAKKGKEVEGGGFSSKKALTGFDCFMRERRDEVAKQSANKGKTAAEITAIMSDRWKEMDAEDKAHFEEMAVEEKRRYEHELVEGKENGGGDSMSGDDDDGGGAQQKSKAKQTTLSFTVKKEPSMASDGEDTRSSKPPAKKIKTEKTEF